MQLIPVIDLLNGKVVHAKRGDRKNYLPIESLLSTSSDPLPVIAAMLDYYPFTHLYIADLNAIQNTGQHNLGIIQQIMHQYPTLELWVDAGVQHLYALCELGNRNFNVILGSENFSDLNQYLAIKKQLQDTFVLSLDFMPEGYRGPAELLENTANWPQTVIIMTLANVGSNQGPNLELIRNFAHHAQRFSLFAAGGIRHIEDIHQLQKTGISGALLASAIHHKQILSQDLRNIQQSS